jgi:phosphoribosylformylglycinamidine cyclo-ligase
MIQHESGTSWREMYQVFNMGHRFEFYADESVAGKIIEIASTFNVDARIVGRCESSATPRLTILGEGGSHQY